MPSEQSRTGLIIRHHSQSVLVETEDGTRLECKTRKKTGRIVCGDQVHWEPTGDQEGVVTELLARRSLLTRPDAQQRPRPLAANIDQILIVCAPEPEYSKQLIDRYLIAAALMPAEALLVLNKSDLLNAEQLATHQAELQEFVAIGIPLFITSKHQPESIATLKQALQGHTSILVGQSGVGKSSLINSFLPGDDARVGEISNSTGHGRHTTTETQLYHLPSGGHLIDSPGVRDFQLWHVEPEELIRGYREFAPFLGQCRFHNCRHLAEPGCALRAAVEDGQVSERRLASYQQIYQLVLENKAITY